MKLNELRQIIREEISNLERSPSSGLIRFGQLKQACIESYKEYASDFTDSVFGGKYYVRNGEIYDNEALNELNQAKNVGELVNILDGLGFNGKEAYDFIFDSILK